MSNATIAARMPGAATFTSRDYSVGGADEVKAALPTMSGFELVQVMTRLHQQFCTGRITEAEWRAEQRECIERTVPSDIRSMFERELEQEVLHDKEEDRLVRIGTKHMLEALASV